MQYTQLPSNYKYDTLAAALAAREMEYFHYDFDRANFVKMLETLEPGTYRDEVQHRLDTTLERMRQVDDIYNALMSQVDDQAALAAAIARLQSS